MVVKSLEPQENRKQARVTAHWQKGGQWRYSQRGGQRLLAQAVQAGMGDIMRVQQEAMWQEQDPPASTMFPPSTWPLRTRS